MVAPRCESDVNAHHYVSVKQAKSEKGCVRSASSLPKNKKPTYFHQAECCK